MIEPLPPKFEEMIDRLEVIASELMAGPETAALRSALWCEGQFLAGELLERDSGTGIRDPRLARVYELCRRGGPIEYQLLPGSYRIDAKAVVTYLDQPIRGADAASFEVLSDTWARDRKHVYDVGRKITKADPKTFVVLNRVYARDSQHVYASLAGVLKGADVESFEILDSGFLRPSEAVRRKNAVLGGFRQEAGFARDRAQVFHYAKGFGKPCVLRGADVASFQVLTNGYAKDKKHVYFEKWRLKKSDPATFEQIGSFWGRDARQVYYGNLTMRGADPDSFEIVDEAEYVSRDRNGHFYQAWEPGPLDCRFL